MIPILLLVLSGYLIGSIPFGYLVARAKGVDIFRAGSGNIGATNVGRVVGRKYGVLVMSLDFSKGAIAAGLVPLTGVDVPSWVEVATAVAGFLGHLFPIYLGFRGGKGVATGLGTIAVLVPLPALVTALTWTSLVASTRLVSLASILGVLALAVSCLIGEPLDSPATLYCLIGGGLVIVKHRSNLKRLWTGTENQLADTPMLHNLSKSLHVMAVGLWFGSAIFFNFLAAPMIFVEFEEAVATSPNDRTANIDVLAGVQDRESEVNGKTPAQRLASALAGTAVGPIFKPFFILEGICALVALAIAIAWCFRDRRRVDRVRAWVIGFAALSIAVSWPVSEKVSALRVERLSDSAANAAFGQWHLISLGLSFLTAILVTIAMAQAAFLPPRKLED